MGISDLLIGILFTFWLFIPVYFLIEPAYYKQGTSPLTEPPLGLQGFLQRPSAKSFWAFPRLFFDALRILSFPSLSSSLSPSGLSRLHSLIFTWPFSRSRPSWFCSLWKTPFFPSLCSLFLSEVSQNAFPPVEAAMHRSWKQLPPC